MQDPLQEGRQAAPHPSASAIDQVMLYRPVLIPRRGEGLAWGTAGLVLSAWLILGMTGRAVPFAVPFMAIFLLLVAAGISLSNWMDRQTVLQLEPAGVRFQNGLRRVYLPWQAIRQVQVFPSAWGKKVRVIGEQAYFDFRTLGEVKLQGELKGQMGFAKGEQILRVIIAQTGLRAARQTGPGAGYYYTRE